MKSCGYEKWIHRFIDKELDKRHKDEFERHLSACDSCKEEVFELESMKGILSCAREDLSLPQLKYRVMERIEEAESSFMRKGFQVVLLYGRAVPVLAAAALLFIAVSVWDIGRFYSETDYAIAFLEEKEVAAPEFDPDIL